MNAAKLDHAIGIATNVAYLLVVASTLYLLFPGLRPSLRRVVAALMWNYRLGTYLARQQPVPGYVRDALAGKTVDEPAPSSE